MPPGLFTDPDGDGLTLSMIGPSWLSFDSGTGTFSGTPSSGGSWGVQVVASDGHGHSTKCIFNLTSTNNNAAPVASVAIPAQTLSQGIDWSYTLPGGSFTDPNGNPLRYTATGLPPGISFDATTGTFSGQATATGTWTVTVTADDGHGGMATQDVSFTVVNFTDHAPVRSYALPDLVWTRNQNNSYSFPLGTFTDADGDELTYTATLSSGAALPSWLTFDPETRTFSGLPTGTGPWNITVTADDGHGGTATDTFRISTTTTALKQQSAWYTYDALNRVSVANGAFVNGQVVVDPDAAGSYMNLFDAAGHLVGTEHFGTDWYESAAGVVLTQQVVNARGQTVATYADRLLDDTHVQLASTNTYDDDGRLLQTLNFYPAHWHYTFYDNEGTPNVVHVSGLLQSATTYAYDADGRLTLQTQYRRPVATNQGLDTNGTLQTWPKWIEDLSLELALTHQSQDPAQYSDIGLLEVDSTVRYTGTSSGTTLGYDAAGRLQGYAFTQAPDATGANGFTQTFAETYLGYDAWQEWTVAGSSSNGQQRPTTTTLTYDAAGRQTSMREHTSNVPQGMTLDDRLKLFVTDAEGEIVRRRDGTVNDSNTFTPTSDPNDATVAQQAIHHYVYAQGQEVAGLDEAGNIDAISHVTAFSNSVLGSQGVVVQDGDTLRTIAQRVYGNGDLWYILASANGLSPNSVLVEGVTLKAPQVLTSVNDASTFKPYDPSAITGPSTPGLPQIADPPKQHCTGLAMVIMAIIAIVVACAVGPEILAAMNTIFGAGALATGVATGLSAAAGSFAAQVAGSTAGVSHFSWKAIAVAGVSAGITAGVGAELLSDTSGTFSATVNGATKLTMAGKIVQGLTSYGANVAANRLVGQSGGFSWKGVAATVAGSAIGYATGIGDPIPVTDGASPFIDRFAGNLAGEGLNSGLRSAFGAGHFSWSQVASSAFGDTMAYELDRQLQTMPFGRASAYADQNGMWNAGGATAGATFSLGGALSFGSTGAYANGQEWSFDTTQLPNGSVADEKAFIRQQMDAEERLNAAVAEVNAWSKQKPPTTDTQLVMPLSADESDRLAWTQDYRTTLVDPHLIERNGNSSTLFVETQGFRVIETGGGVFAGLLPDRSPPVAPVTDSPEVVVDTFFDRLGDGVDDATESMGLALAKQVEGFRDHGLSGTIVGKAARATLRFGEGELGRAIHGGIGSTQIAQGIKSTYGFFNYVLNDRSAGDSFQGASDLTSKGISNFADYWNSHSSSQMAGDLGHGIGAQIPITVLTAGFGAEEKVVGEVVDVAATTAEESAAKAAVDAAADSDRIAPRAVANSVGADTPPQFFGARGPVSGREFDPLQAGGPIQQLSTDGVEITHEGIDTVVQHISRFGQDDANDFMVGRLRGIADGEIEPTQFDLNFYTHETTEFQRYSNLGWEFGQPADPMEAYNLWNNAHTATLEDYGLRDGQLYHPDAPQ